MALSLEHTARHAADAVLTNIAERVTTDEVVEAFRAKTARKAARKPARKRVAAKR